jgi:hypothetical protein
MIKMNIAERLAVYREWQAQGDLPGHAMYFAAYLAPSWSREDPNPNRRHTDRPEGWDDYRNAAAIRELTRGEAPGGPRCDHCECEAGELYPVLGERLCSDCTDVQLDLLVAACRPEIERLLMGATS